MLVFNTIYRKKLNIVFIFCVQPEKGGGGEGQGGGGRGGGGGEGKYL